MHRRSANAAKDSCERMGRVRPASTRGVLQNFLSPFPKFVRDDSRAFQVGRFVFIFGFNGEQSTRRLAPQDTIHGNVTPCVSAPRRKPPAAQFAGNAALALHFNKNFEREAANPRFGIAEFKLLSAPPVPERRTRFRFWRHAEMIPGAWHRTRVGFRDEIGGLLRRASSQSFGDNAKGVAFTIRVLFRRAVAPRSLYFVAKVCRLR